MKTFKKICRKDQTQLKKWLEKLLKAKYGMVVNGDGFLYAKGKSNCPILLTAHMDTVHKETCVDIKVSNIQGKTILTSPQGIGGDDRCGIWMIWKLLCFTKYRPSILFCEDEEIGGVGSSKFVKTKYVDDLKELKYLVELDRANSNDAVYYDCGNEEFMDYISETIGYKEAYGSFSDIGHLSPACDKASVNLSCGYYKQHTLQEYVVFEEMKDTYKAVIKLCSKAKECEAFDYQEYSFMSKDYGDSWLTGLYSNKKWYEDDDDNYYEIIFNGDKGEDTFIIETDSYEEALGCFMLNYTDKCYQDIIEVVKYN